MTLPRRTLLTRIAAALAALSAPVVALGVGRCRNHGLVANVKRIHVKPGSIFVLTLPEEADFTALRPMLAECGEFINSHGGCFLAAKPGMDLAGYDGPRFSRCCDSEARGLLAEAREKLHRLGIKRAMRVRWEEGEMSDHCMFLCRIDKHLGRGAGREG